MSTFNKQLTSQIFLSILFAAATSLLLNTIATTHQIGGLWWFILSIIVIVIIIAVITYILEIPFFPESSDDSIRFLKIFLIIIATLILFAISRFISFFYNKNISIIDIEDSFRWIWILVLLCGINTGILAIIEFRINRSEKNYKNLIICTVIFIILSSVMILASGLLLKLRGVIT